MPQVQGQTGIGALALRLNHILVEHIRALLPSLCAHLEDAMERRGKELKKYGAMPPGSTSAARSVSLCVSQGGLGGVGLNRKAPASCWSLFTDMCQDAGHLSNQPLQQQACRHAVVSGPMPA